LGHISKQGNALLRFLLVEAAQAAARFDPEWRRKFLHLAMRRERRIAKVAMARKLAVHLFAVFLHSSPPLAIDSGCAYASAPIDDGAKVIAADRDPPDWASTLWESDPPTSA
jgi:hypothetical protein